MHTSRLSMVIAAVVLGVSCGGDDDGSVDSTTATSAVTTAPSPTTSLVTTTTQPAALAQPAIWPAADVVFATPEEAAADFVRSVFGVEPLLGEYMGGDSRSGEIEVFSPGETTPVSRSLLAVRMLGPDDGWFVIAAANPNVTISVPEVNAEVPAGEVTVEGVARGYESTVVVTAFLSGDVSTVLDQVITSGGAMATPEPYSITIDLTSAAVGDTITLLVRGDTGLENDPGEFGAIPIVISN